MTFNGTRFTMQFHGRYRGQNNPNYQWAPEDVRTISGPGVITSIELPRNGTLVYMIKTINGQPKYSFLIMMEVVWLLGIKIM